jgi:3-oxoacyl-[acyl-carrier protein] reductase
MSEAQKQIALVTGASRGIGASIALHLAQQGFVVIGTATSDDGAAKISQALSAFPGSRGANLNVNDAAAGEATLERRRRWLTLQPEPAGVPLRC